MGLPVPLELPTPLGSGQLIAAPPVRVVVLPLEVYRTGALLRVHIQHSAPPPQIAEEPGHALLPHPGHEDEAIQMLTGSGAGLAARALRVVSGATNGPARWDLEFWWPRDDWAADPGPRLIWPLVGLAIPVEASGVEDAASRAT